MRILSQIMKLKGYLVKKFCTKACHDSDSEHTVRQTFDMAPSTSIWTGQCKTKTADWRPGVKCRLKVKMQTEGKNADCGLQTFQYRRCYFSYPFLTGKRVIQANLSESLQCYG